VASAEPRLDLTKFQCPEGVLDPGREQAMLDLLLDYLADSRQFDIGHFAPEDDEAEIAERPNGFGTA
jgi:hypothetical protein